MVGTVRNDCACREKHMVELRRCSSRGRDTLHCRFVDRMNDRVNEELSHWVIVHSKSSTIKAQKPSSYILSPALRALPKYSATIEVIHVLEDVVVVDRRKVVSSVCREREDSPASRITVTTIMFLNLLQKMG